MSYEALNSLTEQIRVLNKALDSRITALENRLDSGPLNQEGINELTRLNSAISNTVAQAKQVQTEIKEQQLASQRPPTMSGYQGSNSSTFKSASTRAIEKWFRVGGDASALSHEEKSWISFPHMDMSRYAPETKVLVSAAADLGGFFAGTDMSDKFVQKLFLVSPMRSLADTQTIGGEKLLIPSEGATDTNVFWSDEQTGYVASPDPNLGMIEIYARELNGYLKLSRQNLEDSVFDIEAFILKRLTRQFAQKEGTAFISGNGIARPEGILTIAALSSFGGMNGITTADGTNFTIQPQDLIQLMHAGKSAYRATGTWLMSNATIGACRLFADLQQRPLWQLFGDSFKETLFGRPIVEMPDMPNPTAVLTVPSSGVVGGQQKFTASQLGPVFFGDFSQGYQIVDRVGLTFQTLKELYAIQNQVAYLARMRVGGKVVLPEAISVLKIHA
jgi:HK97 family phage major capsid protein